ncbi:MAG: carboxy terminal-processing peptidase [Flavobacteriales bacterium]|jgi:carboxyl-terminal processing protease|nr:carboxy terminal-processing peptidase [Flavobacteriales bacterium]
MKIKGIQFVVATVAALLLSSYIIKESGPGTPESDSSDTKNTLLVQILMESLQSSHYEPKLIDDEFSKGAFKLYLERLDFSKRFLLKQDVESLKDYELQMDDQLNNGEFTLFDKSWELLQSRLKESQEYYKEILEKPFDFKQDEMLELDSEKRDYAETREDLKAHWRQILKYQCISRIAEMEERQNKAIEESDTATVLSFEEMESKARAKVLKSNNRFFDRMSKWDRNDQMEVYINSAVNVFGPHTGYFAPKKKENFDISMSGQLEGIGAQLQEKDGLITVTSIVPGSASYRQGELEEKDKILKVAQAKGDAVDVVDMRLDDAVKLIRGKKGTEVRLTVKKVSGSVVEIAITRDVVILAETYAKSAIVKNESGARVGYIYLPKFYADFNRTGGRAAADDVKKELVKLKAEGIDGVVLDLRGNGGGSLRDAIEMTGHFIDNGPVVQVKSRYSKPEVMIDRKPGQVYDGPLVVMLNHFSASASEILAAAIQDYDRGIIMGTTGSFGKGTVQRFVNLDRMVTSNNAGLKPMGSVKVTTQKFYRINGGATQLKGVESDIVMPDRYNLLDMGEREQDFVMPWDEIPAAEYEIWKPWYNEKAIINSSEARISQDEVAMKIKDNSKRLKEQSDDTQVTLNYDAFLAEKEELDKESEAFKELMKPIEGLTVENVSIDLEEIGQDTVKVDLNEKWLKKLGKDVFLNEAVNVVSDMRRGA